MSLSNSPSSSSNNNSNGPSNLANSSSSNVQQQFVSGEQFSLVWNTFPRNLSSGLYNLLAGEQLVDVTLAAEGQILRAHKLILSVCSTYFRDLFKGNSCKHPIVILKDVNYRDLSAMLHFMYQGEVNIKQEDIASFLKVAEILKIKGLTRTADDDNEMDKDVVELTSQFASQQQSSGECTQPQSQQHQDKNTLNSCQCSAKGGRESLKDPPNICIYNSGENLQDAGNKGQDDLSCMANDEPLDCSASIDKSVKSEYDYHDQKTGIGVNSQNFAPDIDLVTRPSMHAEGTDCYESVSNPPIINYNPAHCQSDALGFTETSHQKDVMETAASSSKGRRTVKGLPGSSLSLETTLRVISELGPTLRMERGKVIRMYSCPWCLRHFTRKENLKLHVRYIHGPLESLTCKLCGNKYKNSNSLRVHSYLYHNAQRNKGNKSSGTAENA